MAIRRRLAALVPLLALAAGPGPRDDFPDDLVRWEPAAPTPVFAGAGGDAWDRKIRERGWVLRDGDLYHLWYTGYNDDRSDNRSLGHATSPDGLRWERDPIRPLVDDSWVEDMCVVRADGQFLMFAEGRNDIAHLLTSPDGRDWTERGPLDIRKADGTPIPPGPRGTPTVLVEGGTWHLFYERGDRGVWLATSTDRRVWTNIQDDPVLAMGPDAYDRHAVAVNQVVKRGGVYYAVYHANARRPWGEWTTCVARSRDLIRWEKYAGNPVVGDNCSSGLLVEAGEGLRLYTMHPDVRVFRPAPRR